MPYGFLCVAALYPRPRGALAFAIAVLSAAALSVSLETAQNYLPTRIASTVDVLSNIAGAALGAAAGLRFTPWLLEHGPFQRLRASAFLPGTSVDFGLALIALWLFIQLNPTTLLFGAGDLRDLVTPLGRQRGPAFFAQIEAVTAAANLLAIALLMSALAAPRQRLRTMLALLVAAALVIKSMAFALTRDSAFIWL